MSDDELLQTVRSWLDKNGYVLEMEVALGLMPHCSYVVQGSQYTDPVTSKLRETDVFCVWSHKADEKGVNHLIEMVIECKSTTAPWVAFYGGTTAEIEPSLFPYIMEGQWTKCQLCNDLDAVYSLGPGPTAPMAYAVTEKRTGNNGKDHAREAVLSVTSAAIALLDEGRSYGKAASVHYSLTVFPLIVTKSPIVSCSLNEHGDVVLSQISSCWISSVQEKRDAPVRVLIVTYSAFKDLAAGLGAIYDRLGIE